MKKKMYKVNSKCMPILCELYQYCLGSCPTFNPDLHKQIKRVTGSSRSYKKKGMDELKYELFNSPLESVNPFYINHNETEVFEMTHPKKITYDSIDKALQYLT